MHASNRILFTQKADRAGIVFSCACAAHCALTPVLVLSSPLFASLLGNEWIHLGLLALVIPVSSFAFFRSYEIQNRIAPLILGMIGIISLILAVLSEGVSSFEAMGLSETNLTIFGSALLVIGHLINIKSAR